MDYRLLLWKYLWHVGNREGSTLLDVLDIRDGSELSFSRDEAVELERLDRILNREDLRDSA